MRSNAYFNQDSKSLKNFNRFHLKFYKKYLLKYLSQFIYSASLAVKADALKELNKFLKYSKVG